MTMTTKPKTRKAKAPAHAPKRCRARAITVEELAAMDFEPWQGEINTKCLPDNEQFTEAGLRYLITCRMALVMMYRTKAELSEMFEQDGDDMCGFVESMEMAKNFFSHFSKLLDAASTRLFAAGFSVYQNTPEKRGERGQKGGTPNAARPPSLSHLEASRAVLGLAAAQPPVIG
jgi:hypothetical protein